MLPSDSSEQPIDHAVVGIEPAVVPATQRLVDPEYHRPPPSTLIARWPQRGPLSRVIGDSSNTTSAYPTEFRPLGDERRGDNRSYPGNGLQQSVNLCDHQQRPTSQRTNISAYLRRPSPFLPTSFM